LVDLFVIDARHSRGVLAGRRREGAVALLELQVVGLAHALSAVGAMGPVVVECVVHDYVLVGGVDAAAAGPVAVISTP